MKISTKLYTGFAIVTLLAVIVGIVGVVGMHRLRMSGLSMYEKQIIGIEQAGKAQTTFEKVRVDCRTVVIYALYDDKKAALDVKAQFENNVRFHAPVADSEAHAKKLMPDATINTIEAIPSELAFYHLTKFPPNTSYILDWFDVQNIANGFRFGEPGPGKAVIYVDRDRGIFYYRMTD